MVNDPLELLQAVVSNREASTRTAMLDSNARPKLFSKLSLQPLDVWIFCGGDASPCPFGLRPCETLHGTFGLPHAPAFLHYLSCEFQLVLSRDQFLMCSDFL